MLHKSGPFRASIAESLPAAAVKVDAKGVKWHVVTRADGTVIRRRADRPRAFRVGELDTTEPDPFIAANPLRTPDASPFDDDAEYLRRYVADRMPGDDNDGDDDEDAFIAANPLAHSA